MALEGIVRVLRRIGNALVSRVELKTAIREQRCPLLVPFDFVGARAIGIMLNRKSIMT